MAVSVTTRPSTWSAVKNPVVYKFTSTGHGALTNYRIQVEVFKAPDNTSLTGGVTFSFSPDSSGISYADVSSIIKAYLAPDWIEPSAINEVEADTFLKFYIKYQELYDGSATSVVDDVANPRYGVFAGIQIMVSNEFEYSNTFGSGMDRFVPADSGRKFLIYDYSQGDKLKIWRGYPATVSFIYPTTFTSAYFLQRFYDATGSITGTSILTALNSGAIDSVNRLLLTDPATGTDFTTVILGQKPAEPAGYTSNIAIPDSDFTLGLTPTGTWYNDPNGGDPWVDFVDEIAVTTSGHSDVVQKDLAFLLTDRFLKVDIRAHWDTTATYAIRLYIGENEVAVSAATVGQGVGVLMTFTFYVYVTVAADGNKIGIEAIWQAGATVQVVVTDITVNEGALIPFTELLTLGVSDPCDNPVLLFWKNSLGGDSFWLFDGGQESGYNFSGSKKAKRMTLFAEHLTLDQWEALNELNTLGEVYQENIVEFTSSVNKTAVRDGAQVYVVDEDGNKTGVIVIPSTSVINTRDVTHSIEIEIEFPERVE